LSVTEDRLTEPDGEALAAAAAGVELELLDEEQAAAVRPLRAMTVIARSFRLGFIYILLFRLFLEEIDVSETWPGLAS
jgi:phosphosulfolactate phosphohydrolase-like enzyme